MWILEGLGSNRGVVIIPLANEEIEAQIVQEMSSVATAVKFAK